jgi:hypothetical protein
VQRSVCAAAVPQDDSESDLSLPTACAGLCLVTLAVSGHSELLVDSIDGFTAEANLSKTFVVSACGCNAKAFACFLVHKHTAMHSRVPAERALPPQ